MGEVTDQEMSEDRETVIDFVGSWADPIPDGISHDRKRFLYKVIREVLLKSVNKHYKVRGHSYAFDPKTGRLVPMSVLEYDDPSRWNSRRKS